MGCDGDANSPVGKWLGDCRVMACVRRGERTTLYRAWQPDPGRPVALKLLNPECLGQAPILARFREEIQLSLRLDHPNLVRAFASGEQDTLPYLVLEWVEDKSLQEELAARGHLPPGEAANIALDVAGALDYLHGQGIVHRDVKPANILLGSDGWSRLTDLGIAARAGQALPAVGVGTAAYLAPEQVGREPVDPRSDLYSLGVVIWQMLTGRLPFEAEDERGMIMQHLHEPLPPLRQSAPGLGPAWERLVTQALAKQPWDRQTNTAALIEQLERAASESP